MKTILLSQNKYALVDDEDFEKINKFHWIFTHGYARSSKNPTYMHRLIMDCPKNKIIDHKDHNTLNNQKSNLRICSRLENQRNQLKHNSSNPYKGVSWHKINKKWISYISYKNKIIYLGSFKDSHYAALMYDFWAKEIFGEFAITNFKCIN